MSDFPFDALPIQLLSLVIARGDWPDAFLTGMWEAIVAQEGDKGPEYWMNPPRRVWEPGVPDPSTGGYAVITDPAWGIWNAAINNPQWLIDTFGSGDTIVLDATFNDGSQSTGSQPTQAPPLPGSRDLVEIHKALYALFERGSADSATASALVSALASADAYQVAMGGQATLLPQVRPIVDDIKRIQDLSDVIHTMLDVLSMFPIVGEVADLVNSIVYFVEGDSFNGWLCLTGVLLPSIFGLAVMVPRWIRNVRVAVRAADGAADSASVVLRQGQRLADLSADEFARMADQVRLHTDQALREHVADAYRRIDEAGTMSSRKRKDLLYDELTPAYSTVYNPRTGQYHTATNHPQGDLPTDLDSRLQQRINEMPQEIRDAHAERGGKVGSHSEVYALDKALKDDPGAALEDLVMDTRHTGLNVNEKNPQKALGECFPACPHCRWIIDGVTIISE